MFDFATLNFEPNLSQTLLAQRVDANSAAGFGAGQIYLLADIINFGNNATVRAVQPKNVAGTSHGVVLAAQTINFKGPNGLKVQSDGSGKDAFNLAYAYILPQGSVALSTSNNDFRNLTWTASIAAVEATDKPVSLIGSGSAPLTISANGSDTAVAVRGNGTNINTAGAVTLTARGKANHTITVRDTGPFGDAKGLTFGTTAIPTSVMLDVTGDNTVPGTGNAAGGSIVLSSDVLTMNTSVYTFQASGPPTGNGNGGTIRVASTTPAAISANSAITMLANAATAATANGNAVVGDPTVSSAPKAIQFYPGSVPLNFSSTTGPGLVTLSATGGPAGGNGGTIITTGSTIAISSASAVKASALAGTGDGGQIVLISTITSIVPGGTLDAIGKGSGKGGKIQLFHQINFVSSLLDVTKVFVVTPGDQLATTGFAGSIQLNSLPCQQWKSVNSPNWLKTYWKCVDQATFQGVYYAPANFAEQLNANLRGQLGGAQVSLFTFSSLANYNAFFGNTESGKNAITDNFGFPSVTSSISSIFPPNATAENLKEAAAHELAHTLDNITSPFHSGSNDYANDIKLDFFNLDYLSDQGSPFNSPRRDPCVPTGSTPAPFAGAVDEVTGAAICTGSTLNPAYKAGGVATGAPWTNSKIAITASPQMGTSDELYAQHFAIETFAKALSPAQMLSKTADVVIGINNFMSCSKAWAIERATGSMLFPAQSPSCAPLAPSWYAIGQP